MDSTTHENSPVTEKTPDAIPEQLPIVEITADEMAAPLIDSMPVPTVSDIPAESAQATPPAEPFKSAIKDNGGNVFDPRKHAVDSSGNPRLNKRGRFISRTVGRPAGASGKSKPTPETPETEIPDADRPAAPPNVKDFINSGQPDEYDAAADMYLSLGISIASGTLSDEWQPENAAEYDSLKIPLAAYMRATGMIELTPGQLLAFAFVTFSAKRVSKPKTKERLAIIWLKIRSFFGSPNKQQKQIQ
jgi:hypothetical protein